MASRVYGPPSGGKGFRDGSGPPQNRAGSETVGKTKEEVGGDDPPIFYRWGVINIATLRTAIQINDGLSPAVKSMNRALGMVINSFEHLQTTASSPMNMTALRSARDELARASAAYDQYETQVQQAADQQDRLNQRVRTGGGLLRNMFIAIGGAAVVNKLADMTDQYTSTQARIAMINDGLQTNAELNDKILASANRARASYTDTAAVVAKLGITASSAFKNNDEMIRFSELMSKNFKVAGASAQEQTSAMYQLTQAMAAGKLQGDEFRSILENAPLLAQAIAKQMGKPMGELKEMSSQGLITSDIIKSALFNSADQIESRFKKMPMTIAEAGTRVWNELNQSLQPTFQAISQGLNYMATNWSTIEPIIVGLTAAVAIFTVATLAQAAATWLAVEANRALIVTMLSNPLLWIAVIVGILIGFIYKWVKANGGLETSLMILWDVALRVWDGMKIGAATAVSGALNAWDGFMIGIQAVVTGIQNVFGAMKVNVLMSIQGMVNGAIDLINGMISAVNNIPGVAINPISKATFGAEAAIQEQANQKARMQNFADFAADKRAAADARNQAIAGMQSRANTDALRRQAEIRVAKNQALSGKDDSLLAPMSATAANTAAIKDSVAITEEDLKYLRDVAEQEVINRFTTAEVKVDMSNTFGDIRETADLDGIMAHLENGVRDLLTVVAEGEITDV